MSDNGCGRYRPLIEICDDVLIRVNPALAAEIGINESMVFLQIEFLIGIGNNERNGKLWTFQTARQLQEKYFPWLDRTTVSRAIASLVKLELLTVARYNRAAFDRTQWFAINPEGVAKLKSINIVHIAQSNVPDTQSIVHTEQSIVHTEQSIVHHATTIHENTKEITEETTYGALFVLESPPIAPKPKRATRAHPDFHKLKQALADLNGAYPDYAAQSKAIKWLLETGGYSADDCIECLKYQIETFSAGYRASWLTVEKGIGPWLKKRNSENGNGNGHSSAPIQYAKPMTMDDFENSVDARARTK